MVAELEKKHINICSDEDWAKTMVNSIGHFTTLVSMHCSATKGKHSNSYYTSKLKPALEGHADMKAQILRM